MAQIKVEFKVSIEAETNEQAKQIMTNLMTLKKATTPEQLEKFANAIKQKPGLINTALKFI